MTYTTYIFLLNILISITLVNTSPCDIIENMLCLCHSSLSSDSEQLICNNNAGESINSTIKLKAEVRENVRSFDSFHLTFNDQNISINGMFINELSYLFPRLLTNEGKAKSKISITLSFPNFLQLNFEDYAFYQLFGEKTPYQTSLTLELTSNGQITFSPMALNQLYVDKFSLHSSSLEPYSFEEIFNNTNIDELFIEGVTPRSNQTYRTNFNGKIRLAKFTKMVETISSEEFPDYPVRSLIIEAHEARKINASTFFNYRNLYGLHIIRPKFFFDNRSLDGLQYLTSLEDIHIDAETIKDNTFQHTSRIRFLTFGPNLRHLSEHSLDHLNYLTRFDTSKVLLDQLYPTSRCVLARFIKKQQENNPSIIILPPQAEYCDCIYDFIVTILNEKADQFYADLCSENQQERCQLNQCDVLKDFQIPPDEQKNTLSIDEGILDTSNNDQSETTHKLPTYVHRHPSNDQQIEETNTDKEDSQTSALKANTPLDPNAIPIDDNEETTTLTSTVTDRNFEHEARILALRNEGLKWLALSLVCVTILCLLLVITIIWFFTCRRRSYQYQSGFRPVSTNSSNV